VTDLSPRIETGPGTAYVGTPDGWKHIGYTDGGAQFSFAPLLDIDGSALANAMRPLTEISIELDLSGWYSAFGKIVKAFMSLAGFTPGAMHDFDARERPRWHRRHCPLCNPAAFATPPDPYGREYHRRQQARGRRSRR
jgi:hypothetical protein